MNLDKSMFEFYNAFEQVLSQMNKSHEIELMHRHIYEKRRPLDEIIHLTENAGFVIRRLNHHQFNYRFADAAALFNHFFIRLAFKGSWQKLVADNSEAVFRKTADILDMQAEKTGCVNLSIPFVVIDAVHK
jgi:hypothetical protein